MGGRGRSVGDGSHVGPARPGPALRRHSAADKWHRLPPTAQPDAVYPAGRLQRLD